MTVAEGAQVAIDPEASPAGARAVAERWVEAHVPQAWRAAAAEGPAALRAVRPPADYEAWYPVFAASGMVVPTWERAYGGLGVSNDVAAAIDEALQPYRLHRLNPLGLHNAAAALFAHGTHEQRLRFLPPIVANQERWCQLFSEPGAGSDLASLACRAERDGDEWTVTGQKVWTTWAAEADLAILLARTSPAEAKHRGITYFVLDLHQPGVSVRPLRQITGEAEFNEVWLDEARIPDAQRIGEIGDGWRVSASTLSSERQMVSGSGPGSASGRLGGVSAQRVIAIARELGKWADPVVRQTLIGLWSEEQIRTWTNLRGAPASIGKVHQATLNQRTQVALVDLLGAGATAWTGPCPSGPDEYGEALRAEVRGMLRSRANSIEGGTTEINKNILGERVLGLPREPDPWHGRPWSEVPRS